jgi:hypothetical protein
MPSVRYQGAGRSYSLHHSLQQLVRITSQAGSLLTVVNVNVPYSGSHTPGYHEHPRVPSSWCPVNMCTIEPLEMPIMSRFLNLQSEKLLSRLLHVDLSRLAYTLSDVIQESVGIPVIESQAHKSFS